MARIDISELHIKVVGSSAQLSSTLRSANRDIAHFGRQRGHVDGLAGSFRELEKILARTLIIYAAFAAIDFTVGQFIDSVKLAADAELAEISLETLLGSAEDAQKTLNDLYRFVETTPFRLTEVRDSTQLLAAFGFETEKLLPTLRALGDVSAGINQPIRELADLYGRTRNEQRLYTRDLNQFTSRGIPLISVLAETFGVLESEVRSLTEAGVVTFDDVEDAFARMTAEGGRFYRLTERQSRTTAGEYSNLLDEVDALKREFGEGLLPTLRDLLAGFREVILSMTSANGSMGDLRETGEAFGKTIRVLLALVQGARVEFIYLEQTLIRLGSVLSVVLMVFDQTTNFFQYMDEDLERQRIALESSIHRLTDYENKMFDVASTGREMGETLAESLQTVPIEVRRAQKELERLTTAATADAEKIRKQFATPLEKFEEAAERIANAQLFGNLDADVAQRALQSKIDELNQASDELERIQNVGALRRGTQEELAARLETRGSAINPQKKVQEAQFRVVFDRIFDRLEGERQDLRGAQAVSQIQAQTKQQEKQTKSLKDALKEIATILHEIERNPSVLFRRVSA